MSPTWDPRLPTFTILIGSALRESLWATLGSIAAQQRILGDRVIVGIDALDRDEAAVKTAIARIHRYGEGFFAYAHVGINTSGYTKVTPAGYAPIGAAGAWQARPGEPYHWLGVEQINEGIRRYQWTSPDGEYVTTIGDDDVLVPTAYEDLRPLVQLAARTRSPLLTRFIAPSREILWDRPRMRACRISGCCIWAPASVPLHPTDIETTHDYRWMDAILADPSNNPPVWVDYVAVIARPDTFPCASPRGLLWNAPRVVLAVEDEG